MFNPHNKSFIPSKSSVVTVWRAAHVEDFVEECQYMATNVSKTIDLIMLHELPMSIRMSGHILAGVVRIYSKKLDYLSRDCNILRTLVAKPEDLRQAQFEFVTLPQTLNLDELDLEDDDTLDMEFDNHLLEDITLKDQIPTDIDPYIAIRFDEEDIISPMDIDSLSKLLVNEHLGETDVEMAYETRPNNELGDFNVSQHTRTYVPRPSNLTDALNPSTERSNANSPGSVPEIEKRRDAAHGLSPVSHHPPYANVRVEGIKSLDEILNDEESTIPIIDEEVLNSREHSTFELLRSGSPSFAGSEEEHTNFVHPSPQLSLQPTTPPLPQTRPRKRKHFDTKTTILSNKIVRKMIDGPGNNTHRKRKKLPSSKVGFWRLDNQSKKGQIFNRSLFTGFSDVLSSVFEKGCVASKPYLAVSDETFPEPASVSSPTREAERETNPASPIPQSTVPDSTNPGITVQQTEDVQGVAGPQSEHAESIATKAQSTVPDSTNPDSTVQRSPGQQTEDVQGVSGPQPEHVESTATEAQSTVPDSTNPDSTVQLSPVQKTKDVQGVAGPQPARAGSVTTEAQSPQSSNNDDIDIEHFRDGGFHDYMPSPPPRSSPFRTNDLTTQPETLETGSYRTKPSPSTIPEDLPGLRNSGLSAMPEIMDEELYFLEVGGDTPVRSPATQDSDALSERTRALAHHLKERCASSHSTSSLPSGDLSLSKILAGKTKNIAARMFYETLSKELIDVQQDQPYSDVTLKLMPALISKNFD